MLGCGSGAKRFGNSMNSRLLPKSYVPAFYFAMIYAALEDKDQAFMQLEKGYDERFARFAYLKLEALWDPLRSDERFPDLVRRVGIPP
jgi:hypothetical protein